MTYGDENWMTPARPKVRRRVEVTINTQSLAVALGYPAGAVVHLDHDQIRITWEDGPYTGRPYKGPIDVGTEFILHPDKPLDRERVVVIKYQPPMPGIDSGIWVRDVGHASGINMSDTSYTEGRFREIAVPAETWG